MKRKVIGIFFMLIFLVLVLNGKSNAAVTLDEIQDYTITVDMQKDGSMDIKYHVEWKVLNSTEEGPLEWVQIGIPNSHVDKVKKLTDNIKSAKYSYNYGNYVRVDFKKKYYAGEVVIFEFSINQSYMYNKNTDGTCVYQFTPGWFNDIEVKKATIKWNSNNIISCTGGYQSDSGYLVWTKPLAKGEKINVQVTYHESAFGSLDDNMQAKNAKNGESDFIGGFISVAFIVIIFILIFASLIRMSTYNRHSGFGYGPRYYGGWYYPPHHHHHHHGGGFRRRTDGSSCACVSCACACACAGGGRAGCSKKDFYGTNLRYEKVKESIKKA